MTRTHRAMPVHTLIFDCPRGAAAALAARPPGCAWPEAAVAVAGARLEIRAGADRVARLLAHDWGGTAELAAWLAPWPAGKRHNDSEQITASS